MVGEARGGVAEPGRQDAVRLDGLRGLEQVEGGIGGGAGHRIAGEAVRMQEGAAAVLAPEGLEHRLGGEHRRERQGAAGEAFRQAEEVRGDAGLLAGEQGAGAAEAHGDLVGDQVHAKVAVAEPPRLGEVGRVVHAHAAGALHQRLQHQGGEGLALAFEQGGERGGGAAGAGLRRFARRGVEGIGRGHQPRLQQQRGVDAAVERDVAHGQRAERLAVVAVLQRHEAGALRLPGVLVGVEAHLERDLDRRAAVLAVEHAAQRGAPRLPRGERHQALGEPQAGLVGEAGVDHVFQLRRLRADGGSDVRMGMAEEVGPPAGDGIQPARAVQAFEPGAAAAPDRQQGQLAAVLAHLRAGVPDHGEVAGEEGLDAALC
jgi:hypothetical protein